MRIRNPFILPCALLLTQCSKTETRAKLDGPLHVEFVYRRELEVDRSAEWVKRHGVLRIRGPNGEQTHYANCYEPAPELRGDGTAGRFAYRCAPGAPWTFVYVGPGFVASHCGNAAGSGAEPLFSALPAEVDAVLADLARCQTRGDYDLGDVNGLAKYVKVLDESTRADFLIKTKDLPYPWHTPWTDLAGSLPPAAKEKLAAALRPDMASPSVDGEAFCRAASLLDPKDPAMRDNAARALPLFLRQDPMKCSWAVGPLVAALREADAPRAAAVACELVARKDAFEPTSDYGRTSLYAQSALEALGNAPCPAFTATLERMGCLQKWLCDDRLCSQQETAQRLAAAREKGERLHETDVYVLMLATAYARGPLPASLAKRFARRTYAVEAGPGCAGGAERDCCEDRSARSRACEMSPQEASEREPSPRGCRTDVDDGRRRVRVSVAPEPAASASQGGGGGEGGGRR
jgi:hypothetical protein